MKRITILLMIVVFLFAATQQRPPTFAMDITTLQLTDNLYILEGAGGCS